MYIHRLVAFAYWPMLFYFCAFPYVLMASALKWSIPLTIVVGVPYNILTMTLVHISVQPFESE